MQKNYFKKALGFILFLAVMITALSSTVSARYQYIDVLSVSLTINSSGLSNHGGYVMPSDSNTSTTLSVELQKKNGSSWDNEDSLSASGSGTRTVSKSGSKYVGRGTYRVVLTARVYSSSGTLLETQSVISHEVTY